MIKPKHLLRQILLVLIIPVTLGLVWYGICYTEKGLQISLRGATLFVPGHLHYTKVSGTWMDNIRLEKVSYRTSDHRFHLTADDITLSGHFLTIKPSINLTIVWHQLRIHSGKTVLVINPEGRIKINGQVSDFDVTGSGTLLYNDIPQNQLSFSLHHKHHQWSVNQLDITAKKIGKLLSIQGKVYPTFDLTWHVNQFQLSLFQSMFRGLVWGSGTIQGSSYKPQLKARVTAQSIQTIQDAKPLSIAKVTANLVLDEKQNLRSNVTLHKTQFRDLDLPPLLHITSLSRVEKRSLQNFITIESKPHTPFNLDLRLPNYNATTLPTSTQPIRATLDSNLIDLQAWPIRSAYLDNPKGHLQAHLKITGTLKKPMVQGSLKLSEGAFGIPTLGLHVTQVKIQLKPHKLNTIQVQGKANSGAGIVHVQGTIRHVTKAPVVDLKVTGTNILTTRTPHLTLYTTPDLKLVFTPNQLHTTGTVLIPEATIGSKQLAEISLSNDVKIVTSALKYDKTTPFHTSSTPRFQLYHDLQIVLGNKVLLNDRGLSARIAGKLHIKASPDHLTTANGEILIHDGKYQAYGQDLTISEGALHFAGGPLNNPGLNIRALRTITVATSSLNLTSESILATPSQFNDATTQLTIGLLISGTSAAPRITLFSEPSGLSQNDILSYLLLGRSSNQASSADSQYLWQAASALGTGGSQSGLGNSLKKSLKIDDISIDSVVEPGENHLSMQATPALTLGKQLNKRTYLSYKVGLLQPLNTLRLLYRFNKKWAIQAETGDHGSGMDVYYTIEKK